MSKDYEKWGEPIDLKDDGVKLYQTCGACPEQYEGTIDGNPCYFRLRHSYWRFTIVEPEGNPVGPGMTPDKAILYHNEGDSPGGDGCMENGPDFIMGMVRAFRSGNKGLVES